MLPRPLKNNKKRCTRCLKYKDLSEFNKGKATDGARSQCRVCERNYKITYRYGLTLEEVEKLWATTQCEICSCNFGEHGDGGNRHLCFDHNHKTGKLRGILCNACNGALGYMKDSVEILERAIMYLKTHAELEK